MTRRGELHHVPSKLILSVFARIVDCNKGGHFVIQPVEQFKPKQYYAPNSNVLVTKFLNEAAVGAVTDLLVPKGANGHGRQSLAPLPWLIRKVESLHGEVKFKMACAPAFNYCRDEHTTELVEDDSGPRLAQHKPKILFTSKDICMDLRWLAATNDPDEVDPPDIECHVTELPHRKLLGPAVTAEFTLKEGQVVYFVLRQVPLVRSEMEERRARREKMMDYCAEAGLPVDKIREATSILMVDDNPIMNRELVDQLIEDTHEYWQKWIAKSKYKGRWREVVMRSALVLKMLVFEETGAVVAAPTFSLPEYIGGTRNWDYRFTWVRDTSFTIYALIRLGFTDEANAYVNFILARLKEHNSDGSLQM